MTETLRLVVDGDADDAVKEVRRAKRALKDLNDEQLRAQGITRDAAGRLRDQQGRYVKLGDSVDDAAGATHRYVGASDAAKAAIDRQKRSLGELWDVTRRGGTVMGVAAAAVTAHVLKVGAGFEQEMSRVQAVTGATGKQLSSLTRLAMRMGAQTKYSNGEAAKAMYELASAGFTVGEMNGALKGTLALAAASNIDLADAAEISSNALRGFRMDSDQATHVADVMASAVNRSSLEMIDLQYALKYIGPIAQTTGQSFEEITAALSIMGDAGIKGEQAGTTLRGGLVRLVKPTKNVREGLRDFGLTVKDLQGPNGLIPLGEIIDKIRKGSDDLSVSARNTALAQIFGTEALSGMVAIVNSSPEKFDKLSKAYRTADGDAKKAATTMQNNVAGAFEQLTGSIETVESKLFMKFRRPLREALVEATGLVNREGKEIEEFFDRVMAMPEFKSADLKGKLQLLVDEVKKTGLPDEIGQALEEGVAKGMDAAIPVAADGAKHLALTAARGFFNAFRDADPVSKAVMALFVAHKTGALAAITAYGKTAGKQAAAGMGQGLTEGDPLNPKATGKWGAQARAVGKGVLGAAMLAGITDAITRDDVDFRQRVSTALSTFTAGIIPDEKTQSDRMAEQLANAIRSGTDNARVKQAITEQKSWFERNLPFGTWMATALTKGVPSAVEMQKALESKGKIRIGKDLIDTSGFSQGQRDMLRKLAETSDRIRQFNRDNKIQVRFDDFDDQGKITRTLDRLELSFDQFDESASGSLSRLRRRVQSNMRLIEDSMGKDSASGRQAMARNFDLAISSIRRAMASGVVSTKAGLAEIRKLMAQELEQVYGLTPRQARNIARTQGKGGDPDANLGREGGAVRATGNARGGFHLGRPTAAGRDEIPMMVNGQPVIAAEGEYVGIFNRHQQAELDAALQQRGYGGIGDFFNRVDTPHYMASGGIVQAGRALQRMGYAVAENPAFGGVHPVHVPNSWHYKGMAIDVNADNFPGGEGPALDKAAAWLRRNYAGQILELLWRTTGHYDHLHVAIGGTGAGDLSGMPGGGGQKVNLDRVKINGDDLLGQAIQAAVDTAHTGAQKLLDDAAASGGGLEGGETLPDGGSGDWASLIAKVGLPGIFNAIIRAESGGNPRALNASGASGLTQIMMPLHAALVARAASMVHRPNDVFDPLVNLMTAKLLYQESGLAPWAASRAGWGSSLSRGGLVEAAIGHLFAAGGLPPVGVGQKPQPTTGREKHSPLSNKSPVPVGPAKGRAQPTNTPKPPRWKPKTPLKFKGKTEDALPEFDQIFNVSAVIEALQSTYEQLEHGAELTDENPTRTLPVSSVPDDVLRSMGLSDAQIAALRKEGRDVEVLNQGPLGDGHGIPEHVAELDQLIAAKSRIGGYMNTKKALADRLVAKLQAAIAEREQRMKEVRERIETIRGRVRENTRRIKDTQKDLTDEEKRKKPNKGRIKDLKDRLVTLRDNRERLIGVRTIEFDEDQAEVKRSPLGVALAYRESTAAGLKAYRDHLPDAQAQAAQTAGDVRDQVQWPIDALRKEREQWTGTQAPKIDVSGLEAATDSGPNTEELLRLKTQQYEQAVKDRMISDTRFGVFEGFAPLMAAHLVGSFARGVDYVPRDGIAAVHEGEAIIPSLDGPFRQTARDMLGVGQQPVNVTVVIEGDTAPFMKNVKAYVDGQSANVVSRDLGHRQRLLMVAPGGSR